MDFGGVPFRVWILGSGFEISILGSEFLDLDLGVWILGFGFLGI